MRERGWGGGVLHNSEEGTDTVVLYFFPYTFSIYVSPSPGNLGRHSRTKPPVSECGSPTVPAKEERTDTLGMNLLIAVCKAQVHKKQRWALPI